MPWVVKGKIAGHFPGRSNLNLNVAAIGFIPAGSNQSANDIKNIKAVYFVPAGINPASITQNNLNDYLVWVRYWEESSERLLAEDTGHHVLMKYSPTISDITVSSIGILTKGNGTNGRCVYILDENGILIGKSTGNEAIVEDTTIHGYTATKRTTTFDNSVTLKVGKDYWIQYYFEGCQNSPDAYYLNEQGTEYKNLALNNYSFATPVDMSSMNYIGELFQSNTQMADIVATILQLNQGEVFRPRRSAEWPIPGMTINYFYERNSNYINKTVSQVDHSQLQTDKDKPRNSELASMSTGDLLVIGYDNSGNGMVYVWERTAVTLPSNITDYAISTRAEIANWMVAANVADNGNTFSSGNWNWPYTSPATDGSIYVRTDKGSIKFSSSSDALNAPPASPVIGALYLKANGAVFPGVDQHRGDVMVYYDGNQWKEFATFATESNSIDTEYTMADGTTKIKYFNKINSSSFATEITSSVFPGIITQLNPQPTLIDITQTQSEYIKHYLEINGNEVT